MSDILKTRLKASKGKEGKIFLKNGFRYHGKFGDSDETYLEFFDYIKGLKVILLENISDIEIKQDSKIDRQNGKKESNI